MFSNVRISLFVISIFFITILGILKGAERKAVFFNSLRDYKIHLLIGLIFLFLVIFLSVRTPCEPNYAYAVIFFVISLLINIFVSFQMNRGLKFMPLIVGFSRVIMVFFIPVLEGIRVMCLQIDTNATKRQEATKKNDNPESSWIMNLSKGLEHFIGSNTSLAQGVLINKISVDMTRMRKKVNRGSGKIKKEVNVVYSDADNLDSDKESGLNPEEEKKELDDEELYEEAVEMIMHQKQTSISISVLQKEMHIGYARAGRILDRMHEEGLIGPYEGSKPRKIIVDRDVWLKDHYSSIDKQNEFDAQGHAKTNASSANNDSNNTIFGNGQEESDYEILGISEKASIEEIKVVYKKKMMEYHPDRTGGLGEKLRVLAEEEAKRINNAYARILKDRNMK